MEWKRTKRSEDLKKGRQGMEVIEKARLEGGEIVVLQSFSLIMF